VKSCGLKGSHLGAVEEAKLFVTHEGDEEPAVLYRDFVFDRDATRKYREGSNDLTAKNESCCYSQCAALAIGVGAPVLPQPGYFVEDSDAWRCRTAPASRPKKIRRVRSASR
jgi:hypothetical protein